MERKRSRECTHSDRRLPIFPLRFDLELLLIDRMRIYAALQPSCLFLDFTVNFLERRVRNDDGEIVRVKTKTRSCT